MNAPQKPPVAARRARVDIEIPPPSSPTRDEEAPPPQFVSASDDHRLYRELFILFLIWLASVVGGVLAFMELAAMD